MSEDTGPLAVEQAAVDPNAQRFGFVSVVGAPNAGKSTLVNAMIGSKVSIVSPKVQTTRTRVTGILAEDQTQIVFVDTPGIFLGAKRKLEKAMVRAAWTGAEEGEVVLFVVDASRSKLSDDATAVLTGLKKLPNAAKVWLVLNKVDAAQKDRLLALSAQLHESHDFDQTFMISALKESGTDDLRETLKQLMPAGGWMYPEDTVTDVSNRLLCAEITREKLFLALNQELPYQLTVETEGFEVNPKDGSIKINQVIFVARSGHKGIILGKGGGNLKRIGTQSRKDLEELFERRVHLFLFIKVRENWLNDPERYREMGLDLG